MGVLVLTDNIAILAVFKNHHDTPNMLARRNDFVV